MMLKYWRPYDEQYSYGARFIHESLLRMRHCAHRIYAVLQILWKCAYMPNQNMRKYANSRVPSMIAIFA